MVIAVNEIAADRGISRGLRARCVINLQLVVGEIHHAAATDAESRDFTNRRIGRELKSRAVVNHHADMIPGRGSRAGERIDAAADLHHAVGYLEAGAAVNVHRPAGPGKGNGARTRLLQIVSIPIRSADTRQLAIHNRHVTGVDHRGPIALLGKNQIQRNRAADDRSLHSGRNLIAQIAVVLTVGIIHHDRVVEVNRTVLVHVALIECVRSIRVVAEFRKPRDGIDHLCMGDRIGDSGRPGRNACRLQNLPPGLADVEIRPGGSNVGVEIIHRRVLIQHPCLIIIRTQSVRPSVIRKSSPFRHRNQISAVEVAIAVVIAHDDQVTLRKVGMGHS